MSKKVKIESENVLLFEIKSVSVRKIPRNFIVKNKNRESYHSSFESALNKVSSILLVKKISRSDSLDLETLIDLVRKHNKFFETFVRNKLNELEMNEA